MKSLLLPDHIPVNNYTMTVVGGPPIEFLTIDGLAEELETVDLPDRTKASGGNTKSVEFVATTPKHHTIEDLYLEAWFYAGQDPVLPTYKRSASLMVQSISNLNIRSYNLIGVFITQRKTADLEKINEGDLNVVEWTFNCDLIIPV